MKKFTNFLLVPMAVAAAVAASACDSSESSDDSGDEGGSSGTGGASGANTGGSTSTGGASGTSTGGSTSTGGASGTGSGTDGTVLQPSDVGWMDLADTWNDLGVQGAWYPYGDQYGVAKCTTVGGHTAEECSTIMSPDPTMMGFPNAAGVMCTSGEVAVILPCSAGLTTSGCPEKDYSNMWGAGIGFDLNSEGGSQTAPKHPWNPATVMSGPIIGFSFDIDTVPLQGLRVEIPMLLTDEEAAAATPPLPPGSTTDDHPDGAPYWGASMTYPNSPVMPAPMVNRILWADIHPPRTNYVFDTARMLGVQFHVPAVATAPKGPYTFCISNVKMLRQ